MEYSLSTPGALQGRLTIRILEGKKIAREDWFKKSDPYVTVRLIHGSGAVQYIGRTQTINSTSSPSWDRELNVIVDTEIWDCGSDDPQLQLHLQCMDDDNGGEIYHDLIGSAMIDLKERIEKGVLQMQAWYPIYGNDSKKPKGEILIQLSFHPLSVSNNDQNQIPGIYFPSTSNNAVRLYQDAEIHETLPQIRLSDGRLYQHYGAWRDIYQSMSAAQHFIFLTGWSVLPTISLSRSIGVINESLGELLKRKSEQGVSVVVMLWDDFGSSIWKNGFMTTYDAVTRKFFEGSNVKVALCKRNLPRDQGLLAGAVHKASFTHHQKTVMCDMEVDGGRTMCGYVGGLDLTGGRYDHPGHPLFSTLSTLHKDDFYNGCVPGTDGESGPRQPWHDIHARVVGPGAWQLWQNFNERVQRQAMSVSPDTTDLIRHLERDGQLIRLTQLPTLHNIPLGTPFMTQVLRSVDGTVAKYLNPERHPLSSAPCEAIERSIQEGYVFHIHKAKRFLYIENQYFLGSSFMWATDTTTPAHNLVPYAITQRVCKAIKRNERFCCFVVLPLFPEGNPGSTAVQEVLRWQWLTIQSMYKRIGECIQGVNNGAHPTDYLQFFFLGQRCAIQGNSYQYKADVQRIVQNAAFAGQNNENEEYSSCWGDANPNARSGQMSANHRLQQTLEMRRHQIYVHSKMMIVDDSYAIIGSANINDRSMAGNRDSEIAMGCYQPQHLPIPDPYTGQIVLPKGDIYGMRMSLFSEHFGLGWNDLQTGIYEDPAAMHCVNTLRQFARANWECYSNAEVRALPHGHACTYPILVHGSGEISEVQPFFTDSSALVQGSVGKIAMSFLTT